MSELTSIVIPFYFINFILSELKYIFNNENLIKSDFDSFIVTLYGSLLVNKGKLRTRKSKTQLLYYLIKDLKEVKSIENQCNVKEKIMLIYDLIEELQLEIDYFRNKSNSIVIQSLKQAYKQ